MVGRTTLRDWGAVYRNSRQERPTLRSRRGSLRPRPQNAGGHRVNARLEVSGCRMRENGASRKKGETGGGATVEHERSEGNLTLCSEQTPCAETRARVHADARLHTYTHHVGLQTKCAGSNVETKGGVKGTAPVRARAVLEVLDMVLALALVRALVLVPALVLALVLVPSSLLALFLALVLPGPLFLIYMFLSFSFAAEVLRICIVL